MTSLTDLHAGPGAGFDQPFEMLDASHQRVERTLVLLERQADHLAAHGADAQARHAARDVMRYFDLAAPHHHEDEERHVLPCLREQGRSELADRVLQEHQVMAATWAGVRAVLPDIAQGRWRAEDRAVSGWGAFTALYREHIVLEERDAFPLARAQTGADALRAMADEMASRRGVR